MRGAILSGTCLRWRNFQSISPKTQDLLKTGIEDAKYTYVLDPLCVLFDGIYMLNAIEWRRSKNEIWNAGFALP